METPIGLEQFCANVAHGKQSSVSIVKKNKSFFIVVIFSYCFLSFIIDKNFAYSLKESAKLEINGEIANLFFKIVHK